MICDVGHHFCVPGLAKTGARLLQECDRVARLWPGFVWCLNLVSVENALKVTTVALWNRIADYRAWASSPAHIRGGTYGLWSQVTQSEIFEVISEIKEIPKMSVSNQVVSISSGSVTPDRLEEGKQVLLHDSQLQHDLHGFVLSLCLFLKDPLKLAMVSVWESREACETWKQRSAIHNSNEEGFWSEPPKEELFGVIPAIPWVFSRVPGEGVRLLD